jgi:methyl-accepting chemotaxis protein
MTSSPLYDETTTSGSPSDERGEGHEKPRTHVDEVVTRAIEVCLRAASGDLEARLTGIDPAHPLSPLCHAINHLLDLTDAFVRESTASMEHVRDDQFHRRVIERGLSGSFRRGAVIMNSAIATMKARSDELANTRARSLKLADQFEEEVQSVAHAVASAATELKASAKDLKDTADRARLETDEGARSARMTSESVESVVASSDQLQSSIAEIARQVAYTNRVAQTAVEEVKAADETVASVSSGAEKIRSVARMVGGLARQTRLLALNASIEAARAGEAGRGFQVVASEVKSLASEAGAATDEIDNQVYDLQKATSRSVDATAAIARRIGETEAAAHAITRAVEEQAIATEAIRQSVNRSRLATENVTGSVGRLATAASDTGRAAGDLLGAASELSKLSEGLLSHVSAFLRHIRET